MRALLLASVCLALATPAHAQAGAGFPASPHYHLTEPNYFLTGLHDLRAGDSLLPGEYGNQVKFRIALRYRVVSIGNPQFDQGLYAGYTQNSFWHLYERSAPFFDNNYNPQLYYYYDARAYRRGSAGYWPSFRLFVDHESNGRDGPESRTWNRYGGGIDIGDHERTAIFGVLRAWNTFGTEDNPDLTDYTGYAQLDLGIQPWLGDGISLGSAGLYVRARLGGTLFVTNTEVNAFLGAARLPQGKVRTAATHLNASLVLQMFHGYAENLLTYRDRRTAWRIGLATVH